MTDELDTLRPEVREALEVCTRGVDCVSFGDNDAPQIIRAELLRLARENDEWQTRCLQFQTERDHARQMHADRDEDVQHEWARAEVAEVERAEAHRNETVALGLWNAAEGRATKAEAELAAALKANRDCVDHFEQMQAELAALKTRMRPVARVENGEVRALMDPADEGKCVAVAVVEE